MVQRVRRLYQQAQVFDKAQKLIEKYRARAEAVADGVEPDELRELLYYLVDSVLDRPAPQEEQSLIPVESVAMVMVVCSLRNRECRQHRDISNLAIVSQTTMKEGGQRINRAERDHGEVEKQTVMAWAAVWKKRSGT